jgi:hypothetical protein
MSCMPFQGYGVRGCCRLLRGEIRFLIFSCVRKSDIIYLIIWTVEPSFTSLLRILVRLQ